MARRQRSIWPEHFVNDFIANFRRAEPAAVAAVLAVAAILTIGGFLFFQHGLGYLPCPLCYEQRYAYYFGAPLAVLLWLGANYGASNRVLMLGFAVLTLGFLWTAGIGVFHAGVEWKFWPGPSDCTGPLNNLSAGGLLDQISKIRVVRCDEAAWRFLGISLAGYNAVIGLVLAGIAACGVRRLWAIRNA
jgi:disulfide bond formation protein DsbB